MTLIPLERKKEIGERLEKLGLKFEFFKAIDGSQLSQQEKELYSQKSAIQQFGRELMEGEIGAAISHAKIWQWVIDIDQTVLVLEDDAVFDINLINLIKNNKKFPSDWELINFHTDAGLEPIGETVYDEYRIARLLGDANRLTAYLINPKGAKKLIKHVYPIRVQCDGLTGRTNITGLISYGVAPQLVKNSDDPSVTLLVTRDAREKRSLVQRVIRKISGIYYSKFG